MKGLGTIINAVSIIVGGILGIIFKKKIKDNIRETLLTVTGIGVMVMAISSICKTYISFDSANGIETIMMLVSLVVGGLIGELINLDKLLTKFADWLKIKTKSENDNSFIDAFISASCTVSIGAMAVIGSIEDGINGNYNILVAKSLIDFVFILLLATMKGKGTIFSFIPVIILEGFMTLLASIFGNFLNDLSLSYLSYVGNILILIIGINIAFDKKIRVVNLIPAIFIAIIWGLLS